MKIAINTKTIVVWEFTIFCVLWIYGSYNSVQRILLVIVCWLKSISITNSAEEGFWNMLGSSYYIWNHVFLSVISSINNFNIWPYILYVGTPWWSLTNDDHHGMDGGSWQSIDSLKVVNQWSECAWIDWRNRAVRVRKE